MGSREPWIKGLRNSVRLGQPLYVFFFSSRRRHTRFDCDWSSDVCSSDLATAARALAGWTPRAAGIAATVVGAGIFSAFHYLGPFGDRFQIYSFVFRMIAGLFFSALYLLRGFGITAWTHALYDVSLLLLS